MDNILPHPNSYLVIDDPVERSKVLSDHMKVALAWVHGLSKLRDIAVLEAYEHSDRASQLCAELGINRSRLYAILNRNGYNPKMYNWEESKNRNQRIKDKIEELRTRYPMGEKV